MQTKSNDNRISRGKKILNKLGINDLEFLGQGNEGVVFHDKEWVYKVIIPFFESGDKWSTYRQLTFFFKQEDFKSFYHIEEVMESSDGFFIEKYKYEKSEPVHEFSEDDCIAFLTECWQKKIVVQDCKRSNFIRVNGKMKLIDMDACMYYNDNLFLNACARMYLFMLEKENPQLKKLQRSAINNFNLPELAGLREFVNKVFASIIYAESQETISLLKIAKDAHLTYEVYSTKNLPNLEKLFFQKIKQRLYLTDIQVSDIKLSEQNTFVSDNIYVGYRIIEQCYRNVTLLIKTCAMDAATIEQNIKHIVRQLSCPVAFNEVVVLIDSKKENFLRQYCQGDYEKVVEIIKKLQKNDVIDRYIIFDPADASAINKRWFGIDTSKTHSVSNTPICSQLYAFENCNGDYFLQIDSDVMIGREDFNHDFLTEMLAQFDKNENVVSIGFNIPNHESKPYFGFENGGFVPEVRMGLFHKARLMNLLPLPNTIDEQGNLNFTWYRSMEQYQKSTGYCSIRGGDKRTFFIHPQNYRKTSAHTWMNILDRVEQNEIPDLQYGHFDCEGSFYDWCAPKRNEKIVIVSCYRNLSADRFLRFWYSILNQDYKDFGLILYDDASNNGTTILIQKLIEPYKDRITFVRGRNYLPKLQCEYISIHNICQNPDSIIVCIDPDDALIGKKTLNDIYKKYEMWHIDMSCGRVYQTYRIQPEYRCHVNFVNPRIRGGNVWQHLKTFRKYLFDSIPLPYFLYDDSKCKLSQLKWFEKCDDYAMMIPMVEMSSSPYQMDFINYYYERNYKQKNIDRALKKQCIREIANKKPLSQSNVIKGRKIFETNLDRIEIDITFECNLKCKGCNRSCGLAPSKERMSIDDIHNFIKDSIDNHKKWQLINVLGGEPTLHPDFLQIIRILQKDYAEAYNSEVIIQVVSNGVAAHSRQLCDYVEESFANVRIDRTSYKNKNEIDYFTPFADAPCDDACFNEADYSKACWVASYCGVGLNKNGYYGCSVCGGIDRVLMQNNGVASIAELTIEKQKEHFEKFCRYCGNFKHYDTNKGDFIPRCEKAPFTEIISPVWHKLYINYKEAKYSH